MRWHIIRVLWFKELHRHLANRGGLVLAGLLVAAAALLSVADRKKVIAGVTELAEPPPLAAGEFVRGVQKCMIDFGIKNRWMVHMQKHIPPVFVGNVQVRFRADLPTDNQQRVVYEEATCAIQVRYNEGSDQPADYTINCWYPDNTSPGELAPYLDWFLQESRRYFVTRIIEECEPKPDLPVLELSLLDDPKAGQYWQFYEAHRAFQERAKAFAVSAKVAPYAVPGMRIEYHGLAGAPVNTTSLIAAVLVIAALFFSCGFLLPALTCEERERGILLAQALSPASPLELLAGRYFFYPTAGVGLAAILTGIYNYHILLTPLFWGVTLVLATGYMGVGMTIACFAQTQRAASMGSMCYFFTVSMFMIICQQTGIGIVPFIFLEFLGPKLLITTMSMTAEPYHYLQLLGLACVAGGWTFSAIRSFSKFGWQ